MSHATDRPTDYLARIGIACADRTRSVEFFGHPDRPESTWDQLNAGIALIVAAEVERLRAWVDDLQSGMYINCVYCGHRYGPKDEVEASMADILKAHVEQCPKHPMSAIKDERDGLADAIRAHRAQKADDRCIEDDDRLYAALGDGIKCDRRVGDKAAMLANCERFIDRRCEGGGWPSYAELEARVAAARPLAEACRAMVASQAIPEGYGFDERWKAECDAMGAIEAALAAFEAREKEQPR